MFSVIHSLFSFRLQKLLVYDRKQIQANDIIKPKGRYERKSLLQYAITKASVAYKQHIVPTFSE